MTSCDATTDLAMYREGVEKLLQLRVDQEITNSFPAHAAVLFEQFFKHAQHQVRIFCRHLSASVFDCDFLVQAASAALQRGVTVEILLQDAEPQKSAFFELIKKTATARIAVVNSPSARGATVNFSVMDQRAYRFEEDRDRVKATANMFDPRIAALLVQKFEQLQLNSTKLA